MAITLALSLEQACAGRLYPALVFLNPLIFFQHLFSGHSFLLFLSKTCQLWCCFCLLIVSWGNWPPRNQVAVMKNGNYRRKDNSVSLSVCRLRAALQTDFESINPKWIHRRAKACYSSFNQPLINIVRDDSHNYLLCLTEISSKQQCRVVLSMDINS